MPLYDARYWTPIGGPELTQGAIAIALFDACILHGVGPTAGCAQRALKQCGYPEIIVDGKIGPKSLSALNSVNVAAFLQAFHASLILRIAEVIQAKPTSEKYRKGWTARADHYLLLV
jgi:lysozyme family protein